jgi:hypothetical protein
MVWLFSVMLSFVGGFYYCRIKKPTDKTKTLTAGEKAEYKRNQIEFENFMNYNGRPQDVINDEGR